MKLALALAVVALQAGCAQAQFGRRRSPAPPATPPNKTITVYHLFERKYTGLANKDAGDFEGDESFIFGTFNSFEADNPEADMQDNILEMSTITVEDWGTEYLKCNAPGAKYNGSHGESLNCPLNSTDYCCTGNKTEITAATLPGYEDRSRHGMFGGAGYWFSFPRASLGKKWTEKVERRINGSCLGNAWRSDAGGCSECSGTDLNQCVAKCIQNALAPTISFGKRNLTKLKDTWNRAFREKTLCPDEPFPGDVAVLLV